jgi:hypothetical protein
MHLSCCKIELTVVIEKHEDHDTRPQCLIDKWFVVSSYFWKDNYILVNCLITLCCRLKIVVGGWIMFNNSCLTQLVFAFQFNFAFGYVQASAMQNLPLEISRDYSYNSDHKHNTYNKFTILHSLLDAFLGFFPKKVVPYPYRFSLKLTHESAIRLCCRTSD